MNELEMQQLAAKQTILDLPADEELASVLGRLEALGCLEEFVGKRILVSGARGFLGRWFVAVLARIRGTKIMAVDNWAWGAELRVRPHVP